MLNFFVILRNLVGTSEYAAPVNFTQKPADMGSAFVSCTPNSSSHSLPPPTQTPLVQQSQDFMSKNFDYFNLIPSRSTMVHG